MFDWQRVRYRHHPKIKRFWRSLLPHLQLKRGSLKHLVLPQTISSFPTLDVHHNLLSSRSFKGKMGEGMRRIPGWKYQPFGRWEKVLVIFWPKGSAQLLRTDQAMAWWFQDNLSMEKWVKLRSVCMFIYWQLFFQHMGIHCFVLVPWMLARLQRDPVTTMSLKLFLSPVIHVFV